MLIKAIVQTHIATSNLSQLIGARTDYIQIQDMILLFTVSCVQRSKIWIHLYEIRNLGRTDAL